MKKLLLVCLLAFGMNVQAQGKALAIGSFDLRNAVIGSQPTNDKPSADILAKLAMISNSGFEIDVQHESFPKIGFNKQAVGFGWNIPLTEKLSVSPMIEPTLINRKWKPEDNAGFDKTHHLNIGFSAPVRYDLTDKIGVEVHFNILKRGDLQWRYDDDKWVKSVYTGVYFRLN